MATAQHTSVTSGANVSLKCSLPFEFGLLLFGPASILDHARVAHAQASGDVDDAFVRVCSLIAG